MQTRCKVQLHGFPNFLGENTPSLQVSSTDPGKGNNANALQSPSVCLRSDPQMPNFALLKTPLFLSDALQSVAVSFIRCWIVHTRRKQMLRKWQSKKRCKVSVSVKFQLQMLKHTTALCKCVAKQPQMAKFQETMHMHSKVSLSDHFQMPKPKCSKGKNSSYFVRSYFLC